MSLKEVEFEGSPPWGFRMNGGADAGHPLRISRVNPGSKAELKGVREGDLITSINGQQTKCLTNSESHALLRTVKENLRLGLNEDSSPKRRSKEKPSAEQPDPSKESTKPSSSKARRRRRSKLKSRFKELLGFRETSGKVINLHPFAKEDKKEPEESTEEVEAPTETVVLVHNGPKTVENCDVSIDGSSKQKSLTCEFVDSRGLKVVESKSQDAIVPIDGSPKQKESSAHPASRTPLKTVESKRQDAIVSIDGSAKPKSSTYPEFIDSCTPLKIVESKNPDAIVSIDGSFKQKESSTHPLKIVESKNPDAIVSIDGSSKQKESSTYPASRTPLQKVESKNPDAIVPIDGSSKQKESSTHPLKIVESKNPDAIVSIDGSFKQKESSTHPLKIVESKSQDAKSIDGSSQQKESSTLEHLQTNGVVSNLDVIVSNDSKNLSKCHFADSDKLSSDSLKRPVEFDESIVASSQQKSAATDGISKHDSSAETIESIPARQSAISISFPDDTVNSATEVLICSPQLEIPVIKYEDEHIYEPVKLVPDVQLPPYYSRRYLEVICEETSDLSESDKAEKTFGSQDGIDTSWRDGKSLEEVSDVPVLSDSQSDSDVLEKKRPSVSVVKNVISNYRSNIVVDINSTTHKPEENVELVYIDSSDSELFSSVLSSQSSDSIDTIITDVQETAKAMLSDEFLSGSDASLAKVLSLKELSIGAVMNLPGGLRLLEDVDSETFFPEVVILPEIYDGWVGLTVPDDPRLLVCLSPTQMKNSKSKDASQLLDLHEKFIQRRGYHESDDEFLALQKYHELRQKKMKSSHEVGNSRLLELFQTLDLQSSNDDSISRKMKDDQRPNSCPLSGEAFRERMYEEYMSKLYDLAERRNSKVLKLSSTNNSVPNVNTLQIQSEFMTKVKERMAKLGIPYEQQKKEETSQPKHLKELLELTKECSVWSPCSTPEAERKKFEFESESPKKKKEEKDDPTPPVWTPKSAGPSPTFERKFRSVNFQSPPPKRKEFQPKEEPELPKDLPIEPNSRLVSSTSENSSLNSAQLRLPSAQNPTITLLQKAREGHIPKGAQYLEDTTKTSQDTTKYSVKNEYYTEEDGNTKHVIELTPKKFEGIGPTTREGIPIGLRSEVKEDNQQRWYKRMYDSLHKAEHDNDFVTVRYKTKRKGQYPYSGGYVSEPERLNYDSDASVSKYATLDRRKIKNKENDFTSSTLPRNRYGAGVKHAVNIYKNQPGRIEDYEPGRSSISESEAKQWWDEVLDIFDGELNQQSRNHYYSTPERSPRSFTYALKDTGYDSDSTLVFRRRENNMSQQLSPADQKEAYKVIQRGGEVPLSGLRKPAPERPKENTEIEYFPLSPTLTRIRVHKKKPEEKLFYPVSEEPVFGSYKRTAKSAVSTVPSPPRRLSSRNNTTLRMIDEKMGKTTSKIKKDVKVLRKSPELKAPAEVKKALKVPEKKNIKISVAVTKEPRKSPSKIPSPEIKKPKEIKKAPVKTSRPSSRASTASPKIEPKKKEVKKKPEVIVKNVDKKKKLKKKDCDKENVPEENKFFQNLLLREKSPVVVHRSPSVSEKAKKFTETHNYKSDSKNLNYLKQKKPVSESRFRSLERYDDFLDKIDKFDRHNNVWENVYETISSSRSESPSRSPSLRRIRRSTTKTIEGVVGVKKRSKSLNEDRTPSPENRKSRFKELHKFYSSLERMALLEKTTSNHDLRRLKNEEVIDFDRWKSLRNKEKAEIELNNLYTKLIVDQKEKDLLFQPKETVRWQGDVGLRNKEKSVEDLLHKFQNIVTSSPKVTKDVYKPLWRGNSVLNLAQNLTKTPQIKKEMKKPSKSKEIGSRLWSSLSMDQVNALKCQLSEIYSTVSNLKKERIQKMRQNIQNYEMNVPILSPPESLRVRSNSLLSPEVPKIEKSNSISSGLSEPEKKKISMKLSAEVKERMNLVIPKETLGAVAAQKGKESPNSESSSKNLLLVLTPKDEWEKKSSSASSVSTVIHLEERLFPSQSYTDLKELFGEKNTYVQKPFFNSADSLDPMNYYKAYLSLKSGEVRKLKEKFESCDDLYNLRKESPVRKMYQSDPDLTRDFLSKNGDKVVVKVQEQGDVQKLKKRYEKPISPQPFRVRDRLMPHINVISNKANLMKGNVEKLKDHFEKKKMSLLGQMYTSTPEIAELRDIAPYLECDWVAHRNVRSPMPKKRSASASPVRHSILKDVFANQHFEPEIHRPLYRYQPERPSVTFKEPFGNPIPTPPRDNIPRLRSQESPHRYVESEVNIHYRSPIRSEAKGVWPEDELAEKQAEIMRRIYQEQRRTKYLNELHDMYSRRHTDNFIPSQKSPIPLNRYDDFPVDVQPPRPRDRTPEPKLVARALFNFVGQTSRELTFRRGDIIYVRRQIDKNWYEGEHNAMIGLFPFNYVEIIPYDGIRTLPKKASEGQARAKFNFQAQSHLELSLVKGELVLLTRRVDENWFEGRIGTRKGIFPVSYVEVLVEPGERAMSPSVPISTKPIVAPASHSVMLNGAKDLGQQHYQPPRPALYSSSSLPPQSKYGDISMVNQTLHIDTQNDPVPYRVLYNYRPQNEDELELKEGDVVYVMEKCDDGWYVGSLHRNGQFGTFPGNYVERIQ